VLDILSKESFNFIEVAPLELYDDWNRLNTKKSVQILEKLKNRSFKICSMQSIFYGKNLNIFENYKECTNHMLLIQDICSEIECDYIVFGAPSVRNKPEELKNSDALEIIDSFLLKFKKIKIGIEAVPKYYGTNLLNNYKEVNDFVGKSNNPNLRIHFDVAAAQSTGFKMFPEFKKDLVSNVHLSLKNLEPLSGDEKYIKYLEEIGILHSRFVSIEMKKTTIAKLKKSIKVFGESE